MVVLKTSIDDMLLRPTVFLLEIVIIHMLQAINKEFLTIFKHLIRSQQDKHIR